MSVEVFATSGNLIGERQLPVSSATLQLPNGFHTYSKRANYNACLNQYDNYNSCSYVLSDKDHTLSLTRTSTYAITTHI